MARHLPADLGEELDRITHHGSVIDEATIRRARINAAEAAIAGAWTSELGDILDALGLRPGSEVPA